MRLKDVPESPAYLVAHDEHDRGAMEVWPMPSIESAQALATARNERSDAMGFDGMHYRAYAKLPRVKVWKLHSQAAK